MYGSSRKIITNEASSHNIKTKEEDKEICIFTNDLKLNLKIDTKKNEYNNQKILF
jgi:hypothetical protein